MQDLTYCVALRRTNDSVNKWFGFIPDMWLSAAGVSKEEVLLELHSSCQLYMQECLEVGRGFPKASSKSSVERNWNNWEIGSVAVTI